MCVGEEKREGPEDEEAWRSIFIQDKVREMRATRWTAGTGGRARVGLGCKNRQGPDEEEDMRATRFCPGPSV